MRLFLSLRVIFVFLFLLHFPSLSHGQEETLFNTEIYQSPWQGETSSQGRFSIRHEGQGGPPKRGYFLQHTPGEVAEFHLFVPDGLDSKKLYPLLIVYHGGKDGASGKGMGRRFAKISTTQHPVIVLSPNMYTMDAYNELLSEKLLPIDRNRVVVFGHSSGGMGVRSAMAEYLRTKSAFVPAALISASTTASLGRVNYPPCPYFVMAGENETPSFVTNAILKNRRRTCRQHALVMQQAIPEIRYVEVQGSGHSGATPTHMAVIQHAIAVSERAPSQVLRNSVPSEFAKLVADIRLGSWLDAKKEIDDFEAAEEIQNSTHLKSLKSSMNRALKKWFQAEIKEIAALTKESTYVERDRAFLRYDRCLAIAEAFAPSAIGPELATWVEDLSKATHWQEELAARIAYREIVRQRPDAAMAEKLRKLRSDYADTEYGRNRSKEKLLALDGIAPQEEAKELPDGPKIQNPYYTHSKWRIWRDNDTAIRNVKSMVQNGKKKEAVTVTLTPPPVASRIYPDGPLKEGKAILWKTKASPSAEFSGIWDDVYASWSGLHGYVRSTYATTDGSSVHLRPKGLDHFIHFVEMRKTADLLRCGINFVHQSTTSMSHTITNGYDPKMPVDHERIYFSDCLVTAPAHASYTEDWADRTKDLVLALMPTFFNSVGSSNSETMAITKMMIVGGYLPPTSKLMLKRNGLYPSALLYIWKASLPFEVPYDHELRHRVAYRAVGRKDQLKGKYGHAGPERGNLSIEYHRYDEIAHMRNMIRMAQDMTVLPPEAILDELTVEGGAATYRLKKTALILQKPGEDVSITVSTNKSYDLGGRPLTFRFKLLYGNHRTTCVPGDEKGTWEIEIPWDEDLPEGRTAIALIANNGVHDGNPAIINVYRLRGDLPPSGVGYADYKYNSPTANRRPVLLGLQDQVVKSGKTVHITLAAVDPEGQPISYYKRAGEPGKIEGNVYSIKVPRLKPGGRVSATIIASDGTAGNSYAAKHIEFAVKPPVHAHIDHGDLVGAAPFTVTVSAKGSLPSKGKVEHGWEFYSPKPKGKATSWKKLNHKASLTHTFAKPGLYEIALTVRYGKEIDRETIQVWVTEGAPPEPIGGIVVEGNGVRLGGADEIPNTFDHTQFGAVSEGKRKRQTFLIFNLENKRISCPKKSVTIDGEHAKDFRIAHRPAKRVSVYGSTSFDIEFRPKGVGARKARVTIRIGQELIRFPITGTGVAK